MKRSRKLFAPPLLGIHWTDEWLEIELQAELQLTRTTQCARNFSVVTRSQVCVWALEVRMVKGVEGLGAKLQTHSFADKPQRELLKQRDGNVSRARLAYATDGPGSVAKREICRLRQRVGTCKVILRVTWIGEVLRAP